MDTAISVGPQHIEMFNDKEFELKTIKEAVKVVMDEWQPLIEIMKRDELHFHPHLVFSNTFRSLINVQDGKSDPSSSKKEEENERKPKKTARFDASSPRRFGYSVRVGRNTLYRKWKFIETTTDWIGSGTLG